MVRVRNNGAPAGERIVQDIDPREIEKRSSSKLRKITSNVSNGTGEHEIQTGVPLPEGESMRNKHLAGARKTNAVIAKRTMGRPPPPRAEDIIARKTILTETLIDMKGQSPTLTFVQHTNTSDSLIENNEGSSVLDEWQIGKPQKYFKTIFTHMPLESKSCDAVLNCHPNGLVVVCLAPYHPAILKAVKEIGKYEVRFSKSLHFASDQLKGRK